jgi:hypothetical protein
MLGEVGKLIFQKSLHSISVKLPFSIRSICESNRTWMVAVPQQWRAVLHTKEVVLVDWVNRRQFRFRWWTAIRGVSLPWTLCDALPDDSGTRPETWDRNHVLSKSCEIEITWYRNHVRSKSRDIEITGFRSTCGKQCVSGRSATFVNDKWHRQ